MTSIYSDFRLGFRLLLKHPGLTVIAVFTIGLGIGVATAVFGVLETMYWKAVPGARDPGQLVELETVAPDGTVVQGSWLNFHEYREGLRSVAAVAAHVDAPLTVGPDPGRPVRGELVSADFFDVLGTTPELGRVFGMEERPETPGAHPSAVISHQLWLDEFQGRPDVLGQTLRVNRRNLTVIGVMPARFRGAMGAGPCAVWVPFSMSAQLGTMEKESFSDPALRNLYMFARLAARANLAETRARVQSIAQRLAADRPANLRGFSATVEPFWRSRLHGRAASLQPVLILMAVSLLVLAIVCANVANLLLSRSVARAGEFAVRCALGASRLRLARQCLLETLLLCAAGALIGLPLSLWMLDAAALFIPKPARANSIHIETDGRILAFAAVMCLVATFASSAAAMLFLSRARLAATLREFGRSGSAARRSHRLRTALAVAESALALVVLTGAGLLVRSYRNFNSISPGFDRTGVLLADFSAAAGRYPIADLQRACARLRDRLEATAAIAAVAYADYAPLFASDGPYHTTQPEGFVPRSPEELKVHRTAVSPGYFGLLKIPLLEGRDFLESDDPDATQVMIVNQAFVRRFYGGGSPVGRRVMVRGKWRTIVGLAADNKQFSVTEAAAPHFYLPFRQWYLQGAHILFFLRVKGDPEAPIPALRVEAAALGLADAGLDAAPLADRNALLLTPIRFAAGLLGALGAIALLLAGIGLYGVISYAVSQRTREIGIRIALGAGPAEVLRIFTVEGVSLALAGMACGLPLTAVATSLLATVLVGVSAFDPLMSAFACLFLIGVAAIASLVPALRATRIQPLAALRSE
jgi:predicted permease